jgi:hypothetical protein
VCLKGGSPFSYPKLTHPAHKVSRSTSDLLLELILHDFSGRVERQRVEEFDVSWRFEARHPGFGPGDELVCGDVVLFADDERFADLA